MQPELEFRQSLCQHCGCCIEICLLDAVNPDLHCQAMEKINHQLCNLCGECIKGCPYGALHITGESWSVQDVVKEVIKDCSYYRRSGGGITLSGGEPLYQPQFALALLQQCYENNIHTAIETCGLVSKEVLEEILPFTNLLLFDIKHMESKTHQKLTGLPNEMIIENLHWLADREANIILRFPLIPGMNSEKENILEIANLAKSLGVGEIHIMPFHQIGKDKYQHAGRIYSMKEEIDLRLSSAGRDILLQTKKLLEGEGLIVFVGG